MTQKKEFRFQAQLRKAKEGRKLGGYAARFNERSLDLGGFVEQLLPGCFSACLQTDTEIRALCDHQPEKILARRSNGSLRISEDSQGLAVEFDVPATSYGDDLLACCDAGLVTGMSFGFYCLEDRWDFLQENGEEVNLRSVVRADLFEITATSVPAYPSTTLAARSFPDGREHIEARMTGATLAAGAAARRAKVAALLQQCEEHSRTQVSAELAALDEQLRARLEVLKAL